MWVRLVAGVAVLVFAALWVVRERRRRLTVTPPGTTARDWDPWAVLGLARGAAPDEIARAYREQMKRYHPDRVADLGRELQELAHRKAVDIQRAYVELGGRG